MQYHVFLSALLVIMIIEQMFAMYYTDNTIFDKFRTFSCIKLQM